jgi:hypothetical protein
VNKNDVVPVKIAPWTDFAGNPIHVGDTIRHPSGENGKVVYLDGPFEYPEDHWRVEYGNGGPVSRLQLQVGDKGMAVVVASDERRLKPRLTPLPCPFCGCAPKLGPQDPAREGNAWGVVYCDADQCCVQPKALDRQDLRDDRGTGAYQDCAIEHWNKRA